MKIEHLIMDFDGTCTDIPAIHEQFLAGYFRQLNQAVFAKSPIGQEEWQQAQAQVRARSPYAGWTIATTPAAPAAADPYILAFETAKRILRERGMGDVEVPAEVFGQAASAHPAPWRPEALDVFRELLAKNVRVTFISNSSSATVKARINALFSTSQLPAGIAVKSGAAKFRINELAPESTLKPELQQLFKQLPAAEAPTLERPIYLRRGSYFEALCAALDAKPEVLPNTLCCGDIWEMDLAMPFALGTNVHLLTRAAPYDTYDYEKDRIQQAADRGNMSDDLTGLRAWF